MTRNTRILSFSVCDVQILQQFNELLLLNSKQYSACVRRLELLDYEKTQNILKIADDPVLTQNGQSWTCCGLCKQHDGVTLCYLPTLIQCFNGNSRLKYRFPHTQYQLIMFFEDLRAPQTLKSPDMEVDSRSRASKDNIRRRCGVSIRSAMRYS